ncbi:S-layer homology domain-containing protein [Paenibacillus albiflavus]|uniref:S-layer homology domain-containing protein n=1 Tax=Paenibacillus albiflavus TaxID=2545760 RepID=A0A4R4EHX5_9BACL|nr:S-layer homology domain-containing protein [Paenibacillus albiflavus]TCZ77788.1 S-layer homology domain-containing protein [Paenibacillus albiflavus]
MKKYVMVLFILCLFITLPLSSYASIDEGKNDKLNNNPTQGLDDISGHWAEPSIRIALIAGYVNLDEDGKLNPDTYVTKEEFLDMVVRALKLPNREQVKGESRFVSIIETAKKADIYKNDDYEQDLTKPLTREEMILTLERATHKVAYSQTYENMKRDVIDRRKKYYVELEDDKKLILSLEGFHVNLDDYDNPKEIYTKITKWDINKQQEFIKQNEKEGRQYCSPIINDLTCNNKNEQLIYKSFDRYKTFLSVLERMLNDIPDKLDKTFNKMSKNQMIFETIRRGLISGTNRGELSLEALSTRAQAIVSIERVLAFNRGEHLEYDKYAASVAEINWHNTNLMSMLPKYFGNLESEYTEQQLAQIFKYEADDGNLINETEKFILVDLDDPNDLHRNLYTDKLITVLKNESGKLELTPFIKANAYALIMVNKYKFNKDYEFGEFFGNRIVISQNDPASKLDPKVSYLFSINQFIRYSYEFKTKFGRGSGYTQGFTLPGVNKYIGNEHEYLAGYLILKDQLRLAEPGNQIEIKFDQPTIYGDQAIYGERYTIFTSQVRKD